VSAAEPRAIGWTDDPLHELVGRLSSQTAHAVDALQVAAVLESDGVTDKHAQALYGFADVFALAEEVLHRSRSMRVASGARSRPTVRRAAAWRWPHSLLPVTRLTMAEAAPGAGRHIGARRDDWGDLRIIAHGLLYLLPATLFPAAFAVVGPESLVVGVVVAGGLGWVWAAGASWLAFRLLGRGYPESAARVLGHAAGLGIPVAAIAGLLVSAVTTAGSGIVAVAVGQMAYQMAATLLVYHRREERLLVCMLPGALAGIAFVLFGEPLLVVSLALGALSIALALATGLTISYRLGHNARPGMRDGLAGELGQLPGVAAYAAVSAAYLLHAQGRYMLGAPDVVLGFLPLIIGMGVVEWRASSFDLRARRLLTRSRTPQEFSGRAWGLVGRDLLLCAGVVAGIGVLMLLELGFVGLVSPPGVVMTTAGVFLSAAYFVGFLLAARGRYRWLCVSTAGCLSIHVTLALGAPAGLSPLADTSVFLATTVLLLVLLVAALRGSVDQPRTYR
jgi:hypothetical protein